MTDQTCGVVAALDAEIIGEENAGYSAAHLKDIRDRVAELIAACEARDAAQKAVFDMVTRMLAAQIAEEYERESISLATIELRKTRDAAVVRYNAALAACNGGV